MAALAALAFLAGLCLIVAGVVLAFDLGFGFIVGGALLALMSLLFTRGSWISSAQS